MEEEVVMVTSRRPVATLTGTKNGDEKGREGQKGRTKVGQNCRKGKVRQDKDNKQLQKPILRRAWT